MYVLIGQGYLQSIPKVAYFTWHLCRYEPPLFSFEIKYSVSYSVLFSVLLFERGSEETPRDLLN